MTEIKIDEEHIVAMKRALFWESIIGWGHLIGKIITFYIMVHFAIKFW